VETEYCTPVPDIDTDGMHHEQPCPGHAPAHHPEENVQIFTTNDYRPFHVDITAPVWLVTKHEALFRVSAQGCDGGTGL
jgi:hypothetical protein